MKLISPIKEHSMTFTVRGHKIRTTSQRRFLVIALREEDIPEQRLVTVTAGKPVYEDTGLTLIKFASIEKRSDNIDTAKTFARRLRDHGRAPGVAVVVVDTATGEEC